MDQTEQAKETHRMEIVNDIYKKLHDLDYFLLRYGPKDVAKYVEDDSTVSKYYGTLPFYQPFLAKNSDMVIQADEMAHRRQHGTLLQARNADEFSDRR